MNHKYNVALCIIATGKYPQFIEPLLNSARVHFMPLDNVTFFVFTDKIEDYGEDTVTIPTKHEAWPGPTLHRYKNIVNSAGLFRGMDYIFYCDVDMLFVAPVGREILGDGLTAVAHPGFWAFSTGSWETNKKSTSYTAPEKRKTYAAGGFNGGKAHVYLSACTLMALNIEADEKNGITPVWHDESALNKVLGDTPNFKMLTPAYCYPEEPEKATLWKIDQLIPRLIALAKDHKAMRS